MATQNDKPIATEDFFYADEQFDKLYPASIQQLAKKHWTPMNIAKQAAIFLVEKNTRILDIGSGVGKFCLIAAYLHPEAKFTGVELRPDLAEIARKTAEKLKLKNVNFIEEDFEQINFADYDHFYFYNSFYEHIVDQSRIDNNIEFSDNKFHQYNRHLHKKLSSKPIGTRLATYHSLEFEIPRTYMEIAEEGNDLLKFWLKTEK